MENEIEKAYSKMDPIYMEEYGFYDSWEILSENKIDVGIPRNPNFFANVIGVSKYGFKF